MLRKESPFLQLQVLCLLLLVGLRSRLLLELMVLGLPSTLVTLVLCRVDFSVSSFDSDTDGNINVDISKVSFDKVSTYLDDPVCVQGVVSSLNERTRGDSI